MWFLLGWFVYNCLLPKIFTSSASKKKISIFRNLLTIYGYSEIAAFQQETIDKMDHISTCSQMAVIGLFAEKCHYNQFAVGLQGVAEFPGIIVWQEFVPMFMEFQGRLSSAEPFFTQVLPGFTQSKSSPSLIGLGDPRKPETRYSWLLVSYSDFLFAN
jgi:hypothetical protein